jgi:hypothetical protein
MAPLHSQQADQGKWTYTRFPADSIFANLLVLTQVEIVTNTNFR